LRWALLLPRIGPPTLPCPNGVWYSLHLERPDWIPIYDIIPEEAAASKRRIFDRAAEERALVVSQHFPPFPSMGYVVKKGEGWQWQPIKMTK
jgi:hypothetical protein